MLLSCTLWLFNIAMEHGTFIDGLPDGLPIKNGDFPWLTVSHNQRVLSTVSLGVWEYFPL